MFVAGLNPLLIGAQCEPFLLLAWATWWSLNPLLIGAQCEHSLPHGLRRDEASQSPFDRGSV